ncbi:hypothetical protein ABE137_20870 [Brevibacillus laterosporus]
MMFAKKGIHYFFLACYILAFSLILISCDDKKNSVVLDSNKFNNMYENIKNNFKPEGYVEITGDWKISTMVPTLVGESEKQHDVFQENNKILVYKNEKEGIIVQMGLTPSNTEAFEWKNAIRYAPNFYNSQKKDYGISDHYSDVYPNTEVNTYIFTGKGLNLSIVSISDKIKVPNGTDLSGDFLNSFLEFLSKQP